MQSNQFATGQSHGSRLLALLTAVGLFAAVAQPMSAEAQIFHLVDGNSTASIDAGSSAGLFNWSVDGVNQMNQQSFWWRVGNVGGEASVSAISPVIASTPNSRTLGLTYANAQFQMDIVYSLLGGSLGSGASDLSEQIRISNLSASTLDFHFFQYVDINLFGGGADIVQLGKNLQNKFNEAFQIDGLASFAETVTAPGANHAEAALAGVTLVALMDGNPTTLNDTIAAGPGDVTWAFQWDFTLAPGASFLISKDLNMLVVPEPSAFALASLGILMLGWMRRSTRK